MERDGNPSSIHYDSGCRINRHEMGTYPIQIKENKMEENGLDIVGIEELENTNTAIDELETENINLVFMAIDQSGSMTSHVAMMKNSLTDFKDAIADSKEVDEILIARANFDSNIKVGGYKKIEEFNNDFVASGMTALYDVVTEGAEKLTEYMNHLKSQGMRVKAVFSVFSDGDDTVSNKGLHDAKEAIKKLNEKEVVTAFIAFGGGEAKREADLLEFRNVLNAGSSASDLRKSFNVLSKSVIEQSKSVVSKTDGFFEI